MAEEPVSPRERGGKWSKRRTAAFAVGVSAAAWGVVGYGCAHADPVYLTRAQADAVVRITQNVNNRTPHSRNGHGQCVLIAELKRLALIRYGIPEGALSFRVVRTPYRWGGEPTHELLDIDAVVDGRVWRVAFDMNFPWPLSRREEAEIGYGWVA